MSVARSGPDGLQARTDRPFEAPIKVVNFKVALDFDGYFSKDGDGRLTVNLTTLAAALAAKLAGRGIKVVAGALELREAARVTALTQTISAVPTQAEVQNIQAKVNELIARLVAADHLQE